MQARLLGRFSVTVGGQELVFPTAKTRTLAAYLVWKHGSWVRRDTLRGMLWGDYSEEQAAASLRNALHILKKALIAGSAPDNFIEAHRDAVRIPAEMTLAIDVFDFEGAAQRGLDRDLGNIEDLTAAARAIPLRPSPRG